MLTDIELARQRVASRWSAGYTKRAIINGEWDLGRLVKDELEQVRYERTALREEIADD